MSSKGTQRQSPAERYRVERRFCRACALQFLYQLDLNGDWELSDKAFKLFWQQLEDNGEIPPLTRRASLLRGDVRRLVSLVLAHHASLDEALSGASVNWGLQRMNVVDRNVLRLGLAEMLHSRKVPVATAINEAIELAREYGDRESPSFVNGLLDRFSAEAGKLRDEGSC
jgi:N utilization substance protein B